MTLLSERRLRHDLALARISRIRRRNRLRSLLLMRLLHQGQRW